MRSAFSRVGDEPLNQHGSEQTSIWNIVLSAVAGGYWRRELSKAVAEFAAGHGARVTLADNVGGMSLRCHIAWEDKSTSTRLLDSLCRQHRDFAYCGHRFLRHVRRRCLICRAVILQVQGCADESQMRESLRKIPE
jgi:hypothetical protein